MNLPSIVLGLALGAGVSGAMAAAVDDSPTLQRIRASGSISLGHRETTIPFSYYDDRRQVVGYSQDLMMKAVAAIKAELKLPKLAVKLVPVTTGTRFTMVQDGQVDLECGSTTNTLDRQKRVSFSTSIFVVATRLMVRKGSGVRGFADLRDKPVVTDATGTSEVALRRINEQQNLNMTIITGRADGEAFKVMESGRAVAYLMDDAVIYGRRLQANNPSDWIVVGEALSREPYACMFARGDEAFKRIVDEALTKAHTNGESERLYAKWFQRPIPPRGLNLQMPLSAEMKALFKAPNDLPMP